MAKIYPFKAVRPSKETLQNFSSKSYKSYTEKELKEYARQHLADFKIPKYIFFLDEIPKGATGKLQRIGLAEKLGLE